MVNLEQHNALRTGMMLFIGVVLAGVLAFRYSPGSYKVPVDRLAGHSLFTENISPYEMYHILNEDRDGINIVDIRSYEAFQENHLPGAIHIPADSILERQHLRTMQGKRNLIVGEHEWQSHYVAQLLIQLGVEAVAVNADVEYIRRHVLEDFNHAKLFFRCEKKAYDYQRFIPFREVIEVEEITLDTEGLGGC